MQVSATFAPASTADGRRLAPLVARLLAVVGGFVDGCAFLGLHGFFVAQATGSYVVAGAQLLNGSRAAPIAVAAVPVFFAASMVTAFIVRSVGVARGRAIVIPLLVEAALVLALMLFGMAGATTWAALSGLTGMGVQNGLTRLILGDYGSTNVMTTNTIKLSIDVADSILQRRWLPGLKQTGSIILAFVAGTAVGGLAFMSVDFACLLLPVLMLVGLAFYFDRPGAVDGSLSRA